MAVLVRAPSRLDLFKSPGATNGAVARLAGRMADQGILTHERAARIALQVLALNSPDPSHHRTPFCAICKARDRTGAFSGAPDRHDDSDGELQVKLQAMLDRRIAQLRGQNVHNGAVLVADHRSGDVLAWVVAGGGGRAQMPDGRAGDIDAVTTPRQPGSALKPFLYALALEQGWTAATMIDDSPLTESVGNGLHSYQNYSRSFYGPVSLRQALGNSLKHSGA